MKKVLLIRTYHFDDIQTVGTLEVFDGVRKIFESKSLELAWRDNKRNISAAPAGSYPLLLEWSPRFQRNLWELKDVPGRSEIKIHVANYARQLNGCIALGDKFYDIDMDGYIDVTSSRKTVEAFHDAMFPDKEAEIVIVNLY